jgi:hypothetical protein
MLFGKINRRFSQRHKDLIEKEHTMSTDLKKVAKHIANHAVDSIKNDDYYVFTVDQHQIERINDDS